MAGYVNVRAYAELNDFLGPESRGLTVRRPFRPHQTVKDVLEAMGIPHTEVDLILVNGDAEDFAHRPTAGDRIAVYPMFEALDIGSTTRLRPVPSLRRLGELGNWHRTGSTRCSANQQQRNSEPPCSASHATNASPR
jgi:hypothetical protein